MTGIHLNAEGQRQSERVAEKLAQQSIQRILSSPLERTMETARPFSERIGLKVEVSPALLEIDFGDWTGRTLEQLETTPGWREWNSFRSATRIPNGEMMIEVQSRMVRELERLRAENPTGRIAIFSHGDPIRSVLLHYLGMPLDFLLRMEIGPASISIVNVSELGTQVLRLNEAI